MRKSIFMHNAAIGAMTAAERATGRYMRAPDGHDDDAFAELNAAGDIEVGSAEGGDGIETNIPAPEKPAKPAKPAKSAAKGKDAEKPAAKAAADKAAGKDKPGADESAEDNADDDDASEEDGDEEEEPEEKPARKPRQPSERIKELTARNRSQGRLIEQLSQRLDAIEKGGLPGGANGGKTGGTGKAAPDPNDTDKYPLGHLDDRYIEDKLEYLAEQKAGARADADLQRQQEDQQRRQAEEAHAALLEKVEDLSERGSEKYDDFQESVVEAGMKGEWKLGQATFEAAYEVENGAQILYELSQDKKEALRVSELSNFQQTKFVMDRNAEIAAETKPRTKPRAGEPPRTRTNGANSSTRINPATENLDDFEKAWAADAKGQ